MATKKKAAKPTRNERRLAKKEKAAKKRIPRQQVIPGVGDEKIAAIENAALDYAEIRDERQSLTQREVELKNKLMDLMHAKKLTEYKRNGISVTLVTEKENVKVRVKSEDDLDDTPADAGEAPAPAVGADVEVVHSEP